MRIVIDPDVCTGHGLCYSAAPELIGYDDRGYGLVRDESLEPSKRADAERAVVSCPENAIVIEG